MFDRWSQPHYGVHYAVNIKSRKLLIAAPFGDKFYWEQQRPTRQNKRQLADPVAVRLSRQTCCQPPLKAQAQR
jgi:hypothetical protein